MKTLSLAVAAWLACSIVGATSPRAFSKDGAKRHTVLDYFFLLPYVGNTDPTRAERREMLAAKYLPIIDLKNDYLKVQPDSAPAQQIAVFRYRGTELVGVSSPDFRSDYNNFNFYRLRNGKLRDVTKQVLGARRTAEKYLVELPRYGTTIRVYTYDIDTQARKFAHDMNWHNGKFVVANRS